MVGVFQGFALTWLQNDQFFISHRHQAEDGLPNLEELQEKERGFDDGASMSSVVRTVPFMAVKAKPQSALFTSEVRLLGRVLDDN